MPLGNSSIAHLVGFVIVLRIVFENLFFLGVLKVRNKVVQIGVSPPLLAVDKPGSTSVYIRQVTSIIPNHTHFLRQVDVELSGSQEPQLS